MKYLCLHTLPPKAVTHDQVQQIGQAAQVDQTVKGEHAFGSLADGKIACIFEAPSKDAVANFFKSKNMPFDSITQMDFEGDHGKVTRL